MAETSLGWFMPAKVSKTKLSNGTYISICEIGMKQFVEMIYFKFVNFWTIDYFPCRVCEQKYGPTDQKMFWWSWSIIHEKENESI